MQNIAHNIAEADRTARELASHCMAARIERTADHLMVWFPPGYSLGGVRVALAMGQAAANRKALEICEREWKKI